MLTWETEIAKLFTLPRKPAKPAVQNWRTALPKQQIAKHMKEKWQTAKIRALICWLER